jgi:hypothetical protein
MNLAPVVVLGVLVVCVVVAVGVAAYRAGRKRGNIDRCGRHSHAEKVAAGRTRPAMHDGPPARVSTADFRHTRLEEEEQE